MFWSYLVGCIFGEVAINNYFPEAPEGILQRRRDNLFRVRNSLIAVGNRIDVKNVELRYKQLHETSSTSHLNGVE